MATEYGQRLRAARQHAKLTQEKLRDITGIAQSTISSAERDGQGSAETPVYAQACGVNPLWLATGKGEMLAPPPLPDSYTPFLTGDTSNVTAVPMGTAKITWPPMSPEANAKLERFLRALRHVPHDKQVEALTAATEELLDRLP